MRLFSLLAGFGLGMAAAGIILGVVSGNFTAAGWAASSLGWCLVAMNLAGRRP